MVSLKRYVLLAFIIILAITSITITSFCLLRVPHMSFIIVFLTPGGSLWINLTRTEENTSAYCILIIITNKQTYKQQAYMDF